MHHVVCLRSYIAPADAAAGDPGRAAASRIVRALLRVAPGARAGSDAAVAMLEVALFVAPLLPRGAFACARCGAMWL